MGLKENFRELTGYMKSRNMEKNLDKQLVVENFKNAKIKKEYLAFVNSLLEDLQAKLGEGSELGAIEYIYKTPEDVQYFRIAMGDARVTSLYSIKETAGGSYRFTPKDLEGLIE